MSRFIISAVILLFALPLLKGCQITRPVEEVVLFCFSDNEFGRRLFEDVRVVFDRYQIESRYGLRLQFHRLDQYEIQNRPEQIAAAVALRPRFILAPSHDTAQPMLAALHQLPHSTMIFASRPALGRAGLLSSTGERLPRTAGTRILGERDDEQRASLLVEWLGTVRGVGILFDAGSELNTRDEIRKKIAAITGAEVYEQDANRPGEFIEAVRHFAAQRVDVIYVPDNDRAYVNRVEISSAVMVARLPVVAESLEFCAFMPAVCHGTYHVAAFERWCDIVVQVMNGVEASTIPLGEPAQGILAVNVGATQAIDRPIPEAMVKRAWRANADVLPPRYTSTLLPP